MYFSSVNIMYSSFCLEKRHTSRNTSVAFDQNSETSESFACGWRYSRLRWSSLRVINGLAFPRHCVFVMQITRAVGTRKIEWEDRALPQFQLLRRWILMNHFGWYYLCFRKGEKRLILVIRVKALFNRSNDLWLQFERELYIRIIFWFLFEYDWNVILKKFVKRLN